MTERPMLPTAILKQHVAVLGKTRSGKSSVMRGLVEGLLDRGEPVCIVDPKGDWWGIKLGEDGKRPGYPVVIFGGEHADVPINAHAGAHVAELFATGNRPCLIDLGGWMVGERTRFWIDFASTLFKHTKGQRWLVVDEAHNFAPKGKIYDPDAGKALHWMNRLASEGLGKGVTMLFASQRPQKVHNDTLTSAETLIAMRVLHPSDREAVSDWVKGCGDAALGAKVLGSLAQMDRGEGWVWSPEIGFGPTRVKFPMFKTYDSFRPQTADDAKRLKGWAEVDLEEVKAKLAAVVQEAKQNDPRRLKAEITRLRREVAAKPAAADPAAIDAARREGYREGYGTAEQAVNSVWAARGRAAVEALQKQFGYDPPSLLETIPVPQRASAAAAPPAARSAPKPAPKSAGGAGVAMSKAERRVLTVLAQHGGSATKRKVALLAGYAIGGGGFNNALSACRSSGRMEGSDPLRITEAGLAALGAYDPLPAGADLLDHWRGQLGKAERGALDAIVAAYPGAITKEQAAAEAGYEPNGGGWNNALSRLRTLELIEGRGELRASQELFG